MLQSLGSQKVAYGWTTELNWTEWKSILNIHWKYWCWSWSFNTLATWWEQPTHGKRPDVGKIEGKRRGEVAEDEMILDTITDSMDMNLSQCWEIMKVWEAWCSAVHGGTKSWIWLSTWTHTRPDTYLKLNWTAYNSVRWSPRRIPPTASGFSYQKLYRAHCHWGYLS